MSRIKVCLVRLFVLSVGFAMVPVSDPFGGVAVAEDLDEPTTVVAEGGKVDSPLTVLFGTVTIKTPTGDQKIDVRTYGLTRHHALGEDQKPEPMLPGPTFVFQPGDLLRLRFQNYLNRSENPRLNAFSASATGSGGQIDDIPEHVPHEISIPNNANLTNLHVHGLHVDPKQDNVTLLILPEDNDPSTLVPDLQRFVPTINAWWTRTYQYKLPADHLPGTHWYHAHKHGATSAQVENGMAGTLVIRPQEGQDIIPGFWDEATNTFSHDRVLILQEIMNFGVPQGEGTGRGQGSGQQASVDSPSADTYTTINGEIAPTLKLPPGQVERWRFVMAGANHTSACDVWVGKMTPTLSGDMQDALTAIKTQADLDTYLPKTDNKGNVTSLPANMFKGTAATFTAKPIPGKVKLIAVDGVTIWQPRDVTPNTPAMGFSGNRFDLLIQIDPAAQKPNPKTNKPVPYRVYQNYPQLQDDLASDYPDLFGETVDETIASFRYQALSQGFMKAESTIKNPVPAIDPQVTDEQSPAHNLPPNVLTTDPYVLKGQYADLKVNWTSVNAMGNPSPSTATKPNPAPTPIAPLILGKRNPTTNGVDATIPAQDASNNPLLGWQPIANAGGGGPVNQGILITLDTRGDIVTPGPNEPKFPADLNTVLSSHSPGGADPANGTKLQKLNPDTGVLETGIPAYVSPIKKLDGRQVVMFDKGNFGFQYVNKPTAQNSNIRQFWLNGRQFDVNDFQGNPEADRLINTPLANVAPEVGFYSPGSGTWTHYVNNNIYITNPGYYVPVSSVTPNAASGYVYGDPKPLNNKAVTGLDTSAPPVATTAEEWLLVNNSDIVHPFHIHISPFFVTEIGQLNYDGTKPSGSQWTFNKLTLADMGDPMKPFSWVVGNWWDTIALPPHGYVKMRTWINVPSQGPANMESVVDENLRVVDCDLRVTDNTNVYGSWVLHCHILRHEDRGMMTLVNAVPKLTSLGALPPASPADPAVWIDDTGARHTISDARGGLTITDESPSATYPGTFHGGIGDPLYAQPWVGSMSPSTPVTICVARDNKSMVLSNGHVWGREKPDLITFALAPPSLSGTWADNENNIVTITDTAGQLTFTPVTTPPKPPVWWSNGTGSWNSTGSPITYVGTQVVYNDANHNQTLVFCVTGNLKKIVFGNGITWTRQP